jgi:hypothetical protein
MLTLGCNSYKLGIFLNVVYITCSIARYRSMTFDSSRTVCLCADEDGGEFSKSIVTQRQYMF